MLVLLALASLLVGLIIGSSGVGGVLLIPALMYFGGLETHQAMATALFSFFFTGIAATWIFQKYGSINWAIALPVCLGSLVSSYAGAAFGATLTASHLKLVLAAVIIASSLYSMRPASSLQIAANLSVRLRSLLLLGIGLFTGFLCGMTGAGGGIVSLPVMLLFGFAPLPSIATGQVLQSIVSVSGSLSNHANGFIVYSLVWWVTLFEIAGVILGARIAHALPVSLLKRSVTLLCLAIGGFMVVQALL